MRKKYNTPHRSRVVKTRLSEDEYADFTARLAPYGISQSEFLRQAIRRATIRPVVHVSSVNDELLSAVGKLTAEYGASGPAAPHGLPRTKAAVRGAGAPRRGGRDTAWPLLPRSCFTLRPGLLVGLADHPVAHADVGLDVPGVAGIGLDLLAQRGHKHPQ